MHNKTLKRPSFLKANVLTVRSSCQNLQNSLMLHSSMTSTITSGARAFATQSWANWLLNTMLLNWWMFILTSLALISLLKALQKSTSSASGSATTSRRRTTHTRNYFKRTRPFVQFNEPSAIPENDEDKKQSWGYPSGHVARSYAYALALSCMLPEKSAEIMDFADSYALGRVICGHHYKSDTDASLRLATTVFSAAIGRLLSSLSWRKL